MADELIQQQLDNKHLSDVVLELQTGMNRQVDAVVAQEKQLISELKAKLKEQEDRIKEEKTRFK